MKTYIFEQSESWKRGCNVCISVYRVKNNKPEMVGRSHHNTASWKGAWAQASTIISKIHPRIKFDGYRLISNNIALYQLGSNLNYVKKEPAK